MERQDRKQERGWRDTLDDILVVAIVLCAIACAVGLTRLVNIQADQWAVEKAEMQAESEWK